MNLFFKPAVLLMNTLKYPKKLILLGAIATLVVSILTFQFVRQSLSILDFSHKELLGVEYINPLIKTMESMQKYRTLQNNYLLGDQSVLNSLTSTKDDIDLAMTQVDEKERELGTVLQTTTAWNAIKSQWQFIKTDVERNQVKSNFIAMSALIGDIKKLIITACDTSNLTLDPDIDTYYSMDTYCTKLPSYAEELSIIYDLGNKSLMQKSLTPEDREQIVINNTLLDQFNKVGIKGNIEKVLAERPSLNYVFAPLMQSFLQETLDFTRALDSSILANDFTIASKTLTDKYNSLFNLTYKIYALTANNLNTLVQARVNNILKALYINTTLAVAGLLILLYLFAGVYLSIMTSIRNLVKGSEELAGGDLAAKVELETKDELVQVATSFNIMRDTLSKIIAELHTVVSSELQGDLAKRINLDDKKGFSRDLSAAVNQVSDTFQTVIHETTRVLDSLSRGNLTEKITKDYKGSFGELKSYVNMRVESLEKLIGDIKIATKTINSAAKNISLGNNDLAKRTEQQSAFLEETAASIEEVTATVKQNAENAKQANELAQSASDVATKGGVVVSEVVQTMNDINNSSEKVADIISVIEDIAFQTNILALNAAVEAARAGEQGRGFAVVATEVRNLAQRTSSAAKESKLLISTSVDKVNTGTKLVDQAGKTMEEIVKAVNRVTEIMSEIATASIEQRSGIEQVNQAVIQMDQVTQKNSMLVEEAAHAAQSMEAQTIHMDSLVNIFKLNQSPVAQNPDLIEANTINTISKQELKKPSKAKEDESIANSRKENEWSEF